LVKGMNTTHRLLALPLLVAVAATTACATVRPARVPHQTRVVENTVIARIVSARMDRKLPLPRVLVDLEPLAERARSKIQDPDVSADRVQDWLASRARSKLTGRQRVWKVELDDLDHIPFPDHLLGQPNLHFLLVADHEPQGKIVVMVLYRYLSGPKDLMIAEGATKFGAREVQRHRNRNLDRVTRYGL
jgi:hypothetical protein